MGLEPRTAKTIQTSHHHRHQPPEDARWLMFVFSLPAETSSDPRPLVPELLALWPVDGNTEARESRTQPREYGEVFTNPIAVQDGEWRLYQRRDTRDTLIIGFRATDDEPIRPALEGVKVDFDGQKYRGLLFSKKKRAKKDIRTFAALAELALNRHNDGSGLVADDLGKTRGWTALSQGNDVFRSTFNNYFGHVWWITKTKQEDGRKTLRGFHERVTVGFEPPDVVERLTRWLRQTDHEPGATTEGPFFSDRPSGTRVPEDVPRSVSARQTSDKIAGSPWPEQKGNSGMEARDYRTILHTMIGDLGRLRKIGDHAELEKLGSKTFEQVVGLRTDQDKGEVVSGWPELEAAVLCPDDTMSMGLLLRGCFRLRRLALILQAPALVNELSEKVKRVRLTSLRTAIDVCVAANEGKGLDQAFSLLCEDKISQWQLADACYPLLESGESPERLTSIFPVYVWRCLATAARQQREFEANLHRKLSRTYAECKKREWTAISNLRAGEDRGSFTRAVEMVQFGVAAVGRPAGLGWPEFLTPDDWLHELRQSAFVARSVLRRRRVENRSDAAWHDVLVAMGGIVAVRAKGMEDAMKQDSVVGSLSKVGTNRAGTLREWLDRLTDVAP